MESYLANEYYSDIFVHQRKITDKRKTNPVHYHKHYEIYYQLEGYTKHFVEDKIFVSQKDMLVFIPPYSHHGTDSEFCAVCDRILIAFDKKYPPKEAMPLIKTLSEVKFIYIPPNVAHKIEEIVHRLKREYDKSEEYNTYMLKFCLSELLAMLCRLKCDFMPSQNLSTEIIYNISSYIRKNYNSDLSLAFLSKKFSINKEYLSRKFRDVSGIGINKFITYVRIKNAEELLRTPKLSITEIARSVGYEDSNYFSTIFKKINGISPHGFAKYRKPDDSAADD